MTYIAPKLHAKSPGETGANVLTTAICQESLLLSSIWQADPLGPGICHVTAPSRVGTIRLTQMCWTVFVPAVLQRDFLLAYTPVLQASAC